MNFQKWRFTCIPLLICSFVMMAALTVPASAEFQLEKTFVCSRCGASYVTPVDPVYCDCYSVFCPPCREATIRSGVTINGVKQEHNLVSTTVPASCTDDGYIRYECTYSVCEGVVGIETIPALGHTWEETSRTEATAIPGSIEYTCSVCGDVKYETIPAVSTDSTAGIDDLMTGFEYVVLLFGEVWELMLSNVLLTLFLAASLVVVGVKAFRRLKSASKM